MPWPPDKIERDPPRPPGVSRTNIATGEKITKGMAALIDKLSSMRDGKQMLSDLWQGPQNLIGLATGVAKTGKLPYHAMDPQGNREFRFDVPGEDPTTIGSTIMGPADLGGTNLAHERVHTEQSRRMGPAFIPARVLGDLMSRANVGDPYLDHPMEEEAYLRTAPSEELLNRLLMKKAYRKGVK